MRRWFQTILLSSMLVLPALAGRELDNRFGKLDGDYRAETVKISEPDKEEKVVEDVSFTLTRREIVLAFPAEHGLHFQKARVDQIYDTGFKTEITARDADKDIRYLLRIKGSLAK